MLFRSKRSKLTRTALQYLATLGRTPPCRFDAVLMRNGATGAEPVEWIRDAFSA